MKKVLLQGKFYMKAEGDNSYPMIELTDEVGNSFIGKATYLSVEELARQYQKDYEYRNSNQGQIEYFLQYKGNKSITKLFQKSIQQGYGEEPLTSDETNNY